MVPKKVWMWVLVATMLAGCAGNLGKEAPAPSAPPFRAESEGASAVAASSSSFEESAPASVSGGLSARADRAPAEPRPRQGLGTEWGEARDSRVHDVAFSRDSNRPFAVVTMNYDDRNGVDAIVAAQASRNSSRSLDTASGALSVSIRDAEGDPLEAFKVGDRTFVVGQSGQRYSIVIHNNSGHRFETLATVDGLDVVNGKDGSFDNRGYVLMPYATLEIEGFRRSAAQVASFRFASIGKSYAGQMGKARNVGVIGIAFFNEKGDSWPSDADTRLRDTASPFPGDARFARPPRR